MTLTINLECIITDLYLDAATVTYSLTICAPLNSPSGDFMAAICNDIVPTMVSTQLSPGLDNYLQNMYLSNT